MMLWLIFILFPFLSECRIVHRNQIASDVIQSLLDLVDLLVCRRRIIQPRESDELVELSPDDHDVGGHSARLDGYSLLSHVDPFLTRLSYRPPNSDSKAIMNSSINTAANENIETSMASPTCRTSCHRR